MIHFIYGSSGYGKTTEILSRVAEDIENGKRVFILVPEQETVKCERDILTRFPAKAQLSVEVLNFSRLCNQIFRKYGGLSYDVATNQIKSIVMWNTLRELSSMLEEYSSSDISDLSFTEKMLSAVKELKAYNVSPAKLEAASEKIPKDSAFYHKLRDISLIYSLYCNSLSESFSDSADDISHAIDVLQNNNFFADSNVYIDSFAGYTEQEFNMIERIFALADNVHITIPFSDPYSVPIHFEGIKDTLQKLKKLLGGKEYKETFLTENRRAISQELSYLEQNLWRFEAPPMPAAPSSDRSIFPYICKNPYEESDIAASEICRLVRGGLKYRDIAIIVRDATKYKGILDTALEKYHVPYFMSEKTDLMTKPLAKYIFSALRIKESNWKLENVISFLKTGLSDISQDDIDVFEDYAYTWSINGGRFLEENWTMNPDGYSGRLSERGKNILRIANSVRERIVPFLSRFFASLDASENTKDMCGATVEFLRDSNITEKIRALYSKNLEYGNKKAAAEDIQLYKITLDTLYQLSSVLGSTRLNSAEFISALSVMFSQSSIGTIPTAVDEVTIGSASMLRAGNVKCAIILGLNEGEFPQAISESGMFNDSEKEMLSELDITLSASSETRGVEELYFVYRALSACSEKLILTCTASSSANKVLHPSVVFERISALFGYKPIPQQALSPLDTVWSRESAVEARSRLASSAMGMSIQKIVSEKYPESALPDLDAPISQSECAVSPEIAELVFGKNPSISYSNLEKYLKCAFSYYCDQVLFLRDTKRAIFEANNIGSFVHAILEKFWIAATKDGTLDLSLSDERIDEIVESAVNEHLSVLLGSGTAVSNKTKHLFIRLRRLSLLLIGSIIKEFKDSDFRPAFFELSLGKPNDPIRSLSFKLNDGSHVHINGKVDRVDLYRSKEGQVYVRVVDYKTGSKSFSLSDVKEGFNMQMLLYLFAICDSKNPEAKTLLGIEGTAEQIPAGVQYLSSQIGNVSIDDFLSDEEVYKNVEGRLSRTGLLLNDGEVLSAMSKSADKSILCGATVKNGTFEGKFLASSDAFKEIKDDISKTVSAIVQSMKDGYAHARPAVRNGSSPCNYCSKKRICRSAIEVRYK